MCVCVSFIKIFTRLHSNRHQIFPNDHSNSSWAAQSVIRRKPSQGRLPSGGAAKAPFTKFCLIPPDSHLNNECRELSLKGARTMAEDQGFYIELTLFLKGENIPSWKDYRKAQERHLQAQGGDNRAGPWSMAELLSFMWNSFCRDTSIKILLLLVDSRNGLIGTKSS